MSGIFYGKEQFDAQFIISQMLCMQALHYLGLGVAYVLMDSLMGVPLSLDQFFGDDIFADGMGNRRAWATVFGAFIAAFLNTAALYVVVQRAKKCLDFGITLYVWHIVLCVVYNGLPGAWEWWVSTIGSCVATILLGEYVCARREMRDITIVRGV
mmetsp:Transcript_88411/g.143141  ORF Transcript_88411/g.143141 Transcript_88411/m.143141 type:complete len:155 (+) Transcript_88411:188-652(+)